MSWLADWFATHSVQPFEITYEDLVKDLDPAVRAIASFLEVRLPPGLGHIRPRCDARPITTPTAS